MNDPVRRDQYADMLRRSAAASEDQQVARTISDGELPTYARAASIVSAQPRPTDIGLTFYGIARA